MIAVEELKTKFMTRNIAPHGECLVVPGDQFDPDWEFLLEDQGFKVHLVELDRRPVALVSLSKKSGEGSEERTVYTPPPKPPVIEKHEEIGPKHVEKQREHKRGGKLHWWTHEEDDRLLYEWPRARGTIAEKARSLVPLFPGRNAHAINCHYDQIVHTSKTPVPVKRGAGGKWSDKDVEKLVTLWNGPMLKSQIEKAFPGRTPKSVRMLIRRLKKAGKIEKRKSGRRDKNVETKQQPLKELRISSKPEKAFKTAKEEVEKVEQPLETGPCRPFVPLTSSKSVEKIETSPHEVVVLLREIRDLLAPKTFTFYHHCRNCKETGSAEGRNVWKYCPKCHEELIVWNIQESSSEER